MSGFSTAITAAAGVILTAALIVNIIGITFSQFKLEVSPYSERYPDLTCDVHFYFTKIRTECPHLEPVTNTAFSREEGILSCVQAWDKFRTAYAFSVIAVINLGLAIITLIATTVAKKAAFIPDVLSVVALVSLGIAFALSWSQVTAKHCDRYHKDVTEGSLTVRDVTREPGLNLIVAAFALTFPVVALLSLRTAADSFVRVLDVIFTIHDHHHHHEMEKKSVAASSAVPSLQGSAQNSPTAA